MNMAIVGSPANSKNERILLSGSFILAVMVSPAINITGRRTGSKDIKKEGSWALSFADHSFNLSIDVPGVSLNGMFCLLFSQYAYINPTDEQTIPMIRPIMIITPRLTFNALAAKMGPGVGGTNECVIVAPAIIAIIYSA